MEHAGVGGAAPAEAECALVGRQLEPGCFEDLDEEDRCHALLGEGACYAPELTKVIDRRGKPWSRLFLQDPQAMYPRHREMVQYAFTPAQIEDVVAFLAR